VPKSSTDNSIPRSPSNFKSRIARSGFCIITLSVTSSSKCLAGKPVSANTRFTSSTKELRCNCCPATFTAMRPKCLPSLSQRMPWRQAVSNTHKPISWIRPIFSATGINIAGEIKPSWGSCQRSSASNPTVFRVTKSSFGWYIKYKAFCSIAP